MKTPTKIEQQLAVLATEQSKLFKQLETQRANKQFMCGCGKMHRVKSCTLIQSHYYVRPSGCTDGDYWSMGEMQIVCPDTDNKNRLFFNNYDIDWSLRDHYVHNAGDQFRRRYKSLFKEVIDDYEKDKREWWNNYYIDKNHEKFGLHVEGRDYKTYGKK
jgi:hypothetical protein